MSEPIEIHRLVSRPSTFKMNVANYSWAWGVSNFLINRIPFSYSTGFILGSKIGTLIIETFKKETRPLHVYELSAGSGYLSKHVIDFIHDNDPALFSQITFHITDMFDEIVNSLRENPSLQYDNVVFEQVDLDKPSFKNQPDFVIISYGFDTIPSRSVEVEAGVPSEYLFRSLMDPETPFWDTSQFPPKQYFPIEMNSIFKDPSSVSALHMSWDLVQNVKEEYYKVPCNAQNGWTEKESDVLNSFIKNFRIYNSVFNFSYPLYNTLQKLLKALGENGILFIHDFAHVSVLDPSRTVERMLSPHGSSCFYTTFYPFLEFCAREVGYHTQYTRNADGKSQMMTISYTPLDQDIFNKTFAKVGNERVRAIMDRVLQEDSNPYDEDMISGLLEPLDSIERCEYAFNEHVAWYYIVHGHPELGIPHLQWNIQSYGHFAASSSVMLADAYRKLENKDKAYEILQALAEKFPYFKDAQSQLLSLYLEDGRLEDCLETLKLIIKMSGNQWKTWIPTIRHIQDCAPHLITSEWEACLALE